MITSTSRGHIIIFINNQWIYKDTREKVNDKRPCANCGRPPTKEDYDACLGYVRGATSVCCGHGNIDSVIIMRDDK